MKKAFYSFHFSKDVFRAGMVRNMGVVTGDEPVADHSWESLKRSGEPAIRTWITNQMKTCDVVIVLVGQETASRPWVDYEIRYAWDNHFPLVGIRIHGLKSMNDPPTTPGANPFSSIRLNGGQTLAQYVPLHDPVGIDSSAVYGNIKANLSTWILNAPSLARSK